jgi:hypothetical protein
VLVLTGFLFILSFAMIFIFKYPGAVSTGPFDMNLIYFSDFLNYIVNPALTPWILALALVVFILPMLALIYWGVKMIFWFKAKDGIFSLAGLVLWVMAIAALAIILFNDGISFAETAKASSQYILPNKPDTLYVITDHKVTDLNFNKKLTFPDDEYSVFLNEDKKELYIRPVLRVYLSEDDDSRVDIKKRSAGRSQLDAMKRTDGLIYNYSINGDTLLLDDYFTIPAGRKWSADNVGIKIYIPEGTFLKLDSASLNIFHSHYYTDDDSYESEGWNTYNRSWIMTEEGLKLVSKVSPIQK